MEYGVKSMLEYAESIQKHVSSSSFFGIICTLTTGHQAIVSMTLDLMTSFELIT